MNPFDDGKKFDDVLEKVRKIATDLFNQQEEDKTDPRLKETWNELCTRAFKEVAKGSLGEMGYADEALWLREILFYSLEPKREISGDPFSEHFPKVHESYYEKNPFHEQSGTESSQGDGSVDDAPKKEEQFELFKPPKPR